MPGYVIHLAVGKVYLKNYGTKDVESFEKGIIAPDMIKNKQESHYGKNSSEPGLEKFIKIKGIENSYNEGYFLHLLTDHLFYNKFLDKWDISIYKDYNILNRKLIQKYEIEVPKEIEKDVKFLDGDLSILNEKTLCNFIDAVGRINIKQIVRKKDELVK